MCHGSTHHCDDGDEQHADVRRSDAAVEVLRAAGGEAAGDEAEAQHQQRVGQHAAQQRCLLDAH